MMSMQTQQTEAEQQAAAEVQEAATESLEAAAPPADKPGKPAKNKEVARFTRKKPWKRRLVILVLLLTAGGFAAWKMTADKNVLPTVPTTPLERGDISNLVGLDGTVRSAREAEVYASQSGMLESVGVKVGDRVEAGQILAQLETADLQMSITEQQARIKLIKKKNAFSQSNAQETLQNEKVDIAAGLNSQLLSADSALSRAQQELNAARRDYSEASEDHELADLAMNDARKKLDRAWDVWKEADKKFTEGSGTQAELDIAKEAYDEAFEKYNRLDTEYGDSLSIEGRRLRAARVDYQNALDGRNATKNAVQRELEKLEKSIQSVELDSDLTLENLSLQKLNKQLSESVITAPIAGTITAVYAKEGAPAAGLLFIIEETEELVIKTAVKEYDVNLVKVGMPVTVKSDATGEEVYDGRVEQIYPTAAKDPKGETAAGKVEYETEVSLTSKEHGLRVGMNVRLGVLTAEKKDIYSAPFDAVITNPEGQEIVYIAETNAEGKTFIKALPVTLGLETDFMVEISGEGLTDGLLLVADPGSVSEGMEVMTPTPDTAVAGGNDSGAAGAAVMMAG